MSKIMFFYDLDEGSEERVPDWENSFPLGVIVLIPKNLCNPWKYCTPSQ